MQRCFINVTLFPLILKLKDFFEKINAVCSNFNKESFSIEINTKKKEIQKVYLKGTSEDFDKDNLCEDMKKIYNYQEKKRKIGPSESVVDLLRAPLIDARE